MKRAVRLLILGGVVTALTACDQHAADRTNDGSASRPPSSSTGVPADVARDRAVSAYREMWSSFAAAGTTSDWQSPALGQHATGIALDKLTRSLRADQDKGLVTKGSPTLSPQVSAVDPTSDPLKVTITDCGDSTNALKYRKDNGQLADDVPGGRRLINAIVEKQADGKWKVTDFGVHDLGTCK